VIKKDDLKKSQAQKNDGQQNWPDAVRQRISRCVFPHRRVGAEARFGLLRQVDVISTVSGGSIIGALNYLHLKQLFEATKVATVAERDCLEISEQIESN